MVEAQAKSDVDAVIIGAGLSGIGAAARLKLHHPELTIRIIEARDRLGGTWDLFRYPGVRSDSDMYTLGYPFRPWHIAKSLTDGASILRYITDTAKAFEVDKIIEYGSRVTEISFNNEDAQWTTKVERASGELERVRSRFIFSCVGYYDYAGGHVPVLDGEGIFRGQIIEPQFWPEDLDYTGKNVVVVGSGATAVTIVPAMAGRAQHVTMVQRSPTYIASLPSEDPWFRTLRRLFPSKIVYRLMRMKRLAMGTVTYQLARRFPKLMRRFVEHGVKKELGKDAHIDPHFKPTYEPWDQRFCAVPDADLFKAIKCGDASIETDTIKTFTENGLLLGSGQHLDADIVVKATGLKLLPLGGIKMYLNGGLVDFKETFIYKGFMCSGVPNFFALFGYTNASWTLKTDLAMRYVCRLLERMQRRDADMVLPEIRGASPQPEPIIGLQSGYVSRGIDLFPRQGHRRPWRNHQSYIADYLDMRFGSLEDGVMQFKRKQRRPLLQEAAE